ncbi:MAG: Lipoamide acyltransferase component of branched-chain alpha-keto acid dehydrogenase complex [Pseudomonadota bacterium]|jgi:pyruvate dehydrogenase E2 component (dihydrolipoamide acetyltransferase)
MSRFNLPDLGEGLQEAEIVQWHVAVGDRVAVDQPMVAMETAKAVVEVPSPVAGVIAALHGKPGDTVATGAPLVDFKVDGESPPTPAQGPATASGGVVGHMPTSDEELREAPMPQVAPGSPGRRRRALPAARDLARRLGLDIDAVAGTGRDGLVTVADVQAASGHAASTQHVPVPAPLHRASDSAEGELEVLRSLRRAMAQSMSLARDNVMECTVCDDADIEHWESGNDYTSRLLRAIAAGCRAEPGLNAWFDATSQGRRIFHHIDVGIAVDTPDGLLVPVIRDVGNRSGAELRADINRLKAGARDRSLPASDLRDFTFMLSNFGVMAGRYATPVVVPPAVAILGAGKVSRDVVAVGDRIEVHRRMPLSLTFDHRCVTGGEAVRLLGAVIKDLEMRS